MKITLDIPDHLLRDPSASADGQGSPLSKLVAEALVVKLRSATRSAAPPHPDAREWKAFRARLKRLPGGTVVNPEGIDDPAFFAALEQARRQR